MKIQYPLCRAAKLIITILTMSLMLTGCQKAKTPVTKTGLYFDTVISITLYEENSAELIEECFSMASAYEELLSKTIEGSDVSRINESAPADISSGGSYVKISPETLYMIEKAFEYEDLSGGRFSVMCGALTDLWDINSKVGIDATSNSDIGTTNLIPTISEIEASKLKCGKKTLDIDHNNCAVRINTPGAKLDLGAVAKGYIADKMKEYLLSQGVNEGIIQLGGNVLLLGSNPTKADGLYSIGITEPFTANDVITVVKSTDKSIVTSGNYQRYFKYDGKIYHHIIDLTTGFPADTGLNSVTIVCPSSTEADILSTTLFLLGEEEGVSLINTLNSEGVGNYRIILIDETNRIVYNSVE